MGGPGGRWPRGSRRHSGKVLAIEPDERQRYGQGAYQPIVWLVTGMKRPGPESGMPAMKNQRPRTIQPTAIPLLQGRQEGRPPPSRNGPTSCEAASVPLRRGCQCLGQASIRRCFLSCTPQRSRISRHEAEYATVLGGVVPIGIGGGYWMFLISDAWWHGAC